MQLRKLFTGFSSLNFFSIGIGVALYFGNSSFEKRKTPELLKQCCKIDSYYDSVVRAGFKNVLLYRELKAPSGDKGLVIWQDKNCVYGAKFSEDAFGNCKKEEVNPDDPRLGMIALKFFYSEEKSYSITKSKFETMHDYKIMIQALINGKKFNSEFFASEIWNNPELLAEVSRLSQDIIYGR